MKTMDKYYEYEIQVLRNLLFESLYNMTILILPSIPFDQQLTVLPCGSCAHVCGLPIITLYSLGTFNNPPSTCSEVPLISVPVNHPLMSCKAPPTPPSRDALYVSVSVLQ